MSRFPDAPDENDWSPVTSRPGEMFTVEGRIRSVGTLARGLKNRDPRLRSYRRSMQRIALWCVGAMTAVVCIAVLAEALA